MKRLVAAAVVVLVAPACAPRQDEQGLPALDTEEIAAPVDAELSTEEDVKGARRVVKQTRTLPGTFPSDFPLPSSLRLVDYGEASAGQRAYLVLRSSEAVESVRRGLERQLAAGGWRFENRGSGRWRSSRVDGASLEIDLVLSDLGPGTDLRVEY